MTDEVNPPAPTPSKSMPQCSRFRLYCRHPVTAVIVCIILAAYTIAALSVSALAMRLRTGPLDLARFTPAIEKILSRSERMQFRVGKASLAWHRDNHQLTIKIDDMSLVGPAGEFLKIGHVDMGVSSWRLLLADLHFDYAEIENLALRIIRRPDGTMTLTGAESDKDKAESPKLQLDNIVNDLPDVEDFKLTNTRIIFEDQKEAEIRRFDDVDMQFRETHDFNGRSVQGYLTTTLTGLNDGSLASVDFIYEASDKTLTAAIRLAKANTRKLFGNLLYTANLPIIEMMVDGRADVTLNNDLRLQNLRLYLQGDDGKLYWPRNYGEGLQTQDLTKFIVELGFDPRTQTLMLKDAEITLKGINIATSGELTADAEWQNLKGHLDINIPVVAVDVLPAVWPAVWDSGGRHWLVDRMDKGRFAHIAVNVPLTATRTVLPPDDIDFEIAAYEAEDTLQGQQSWQVDTGHIRGTFDYTGVTVDYRNPMLPAKNTTGTGVFDGLGLTLDIDKATIGGMAVTDGRLFFDDLITAGAGNADLHFSMNGSVASVFEYLEREPISYRKKVSLDASNAKGNAKLELQINFPTLHDMSVDDVKVQADAKLTNLSVPGAVKGLTLEGPAFDLSATANDFHISGTGTLDGQASTVDWQEYFSVQPTNPFSSKLEAKIQTDKNIRSKFIGSIEGRVDGIIPADISLITDNNGKGTLKVSGTLDAASIDFTDPFNAVKPKGAPATLKLTGTLDKGNIKSIDSLSVTGTGMNIASGVIGFNRNDKDEAVLGSAKIKGLRLGSNNADIDATWPTENELKANVTGQAFDARAIMGGSKPDADPGKPATVATPLAYDIKLNVGQLYLGDTPLDNAQGEFVGNTGGTIKMASLNGTAAGSAVSLGYSAGGAPSDRLILTCENAGNGLSALGVTNRLRGGSLRIQAEPIKGGQPGDMKGKLVLKDFSVAKAPVLAKLINLLSLPGILNILEQDTGLTFSRAESDITLLNRDGGIELIFAEGRTSGSSLGLTFEGSVDTAKSQMNIQGTAVPMSEVNSILSSIPLVGDILTGGKKGGGIFAATYKMKGPTSDPDVSINPLSVLTPGILRSILFEGALSKDSEPKS